MVKAELRAGAPVVMLVVASDPLNMVATARVVASVDGGPERSQDIAVASERTDIALADGQRIHARVAALDVHGNRLVEVEVVRDPVAPRPAPVHTPPRTTPCLPARAAADLPAVVAVRGGGGRGARRRRLLRPGGAVGDRRSRPDHRRQRPSQLRRRAAVEDRARRDVLFANIGFGVAGALAITAGVLYLTAPRDRVETLSVAPAPGGGQLVLGGTF